MNWFKEMELLEVSSNDDEWTPLDEESEKGEDGDQEIGVQLLV